MWINGLSSDTDGNGIHFFDSNQGIIQAKIKVEDDSFHVENKGFGNLGSKLSIESIDQTSRETINEEDDRVEYNGTYQVMYQTEPYAAQHDLEINIL